MAGVYVHIPFCASRCLYCDFFSTTESAKKESYVDALLQEMLCRKEEMSAAQRVETIYIGGGTPSQLSIDNLKRLFDGIYSIYDVNENAEVTIECNPEDVTASYAAGLTTLPVNRVSMGLQTFDNNRLRFLRRRHTNEKSLESVYLLKEKGYKNISIDLMFGFPEETPQMWSDDIDKALGLGVPHISAYSLMYEEGTPLTRLKDSGKINVVDDETMLSMYTLLINKMEDAGYEHYELSNFCLKGMESRHNMSYWTGKSYIGLGAGAHSYDGVHRRWNITSLDKYIEGVHDGSVYWESETLSATDHFNEYIMTRLRTKKGIDIDYLHSSESKDIMTKEFERLLDLHLSAGNLVEENGRLRLSRKGLYISDSVMSDLFLIN